MNMPTIETLKRARIKWLDVSFSYKDKNHFIEIRTPFPDMFHDNTSLVLYKDADGNLMLSDDGYTMDELGTLGFDTNTSVKRKKYGKNVNGPDKNCPVLPNAYGCHLNSRIIRSFISV